jgi:hypothetical protein
LRTTRSRTNTDFRGGNFLRRFERGRERAEHINVVACGLRLFDSKREGGFAFCAEVDLGGAAAAFQRSKN